MKLMFVFGTRPEVIKLAPVIQEAQRHTDNIELLVCSTGQHRQMLDQAMSVFSITPDIELAVMQDGQTLSALTARLIDSLTATFVEHQPDAIIVQGDTTTAFAAALTAFYLRISIAHVEAGLRTGVMDSPFPEEFNRVAIGRIAHWHFAPTQQAATNLLNEGVQNAQVFVTGNTVVDAIETIRSRWHAQKDTEGFPEYFPGKKTVLVTTHRRENFGLGLQQICAALSLLCKAHPELGFVFPVHLNPEVRKMIFDELAGLENIKLIEPVDFETNLYLQSQACLIITDSGGIQEEAPSFAVPVVVMREYTERGEGVTAGFATLTGTDTLAIVNAAENYLQDTEIKNKLINRANPYGDGKASERILAALLGKKKESFNG